MTESLSPATFAKMAYEGERTTKASVDSGEYTIDQLALYYHVNHLLNIDDPNTDVQAVLRAACDSVSQHYNLPSNEILTIFESVVTIRRAAR